VHFKWWLFILSPFANCHRFDMDFRHNGESAPLNRSTYFGAKLLSRPMKSNYSNVAQLKDLMTVPPMTAAQHAEVMRKRIAHRRMVEEARDLKKASGSQFDKR
jgi:hypothetical protein